MKRFIIASICIAIVIGLAFLAQEVGGISLRSTGGVDRSIQLEISDPVVRGVPSIVHVKTSDVITLPVLELEWRTKTSNIVVGTLPIGVTSIPFILPCDSENSGSLVVRSMADTAIIAHHVISALPAGVDCLR